MSAEYNFIDIEKGGRFGLYLYLIYESDLYLMRGPAVLPLSYFNHWIGVVQEYDKEAQRFSWS